MKQEKVNTNVRIEKELRDKAKEHGISMSIVLSKALKEIFNKLEYK